MRKTAKQISEVPHITPEGNEEVRVWLRTAPAREIQDYIHYIPISAHNERFQLARVALEIRIAEDAAQAATKLEQQVDRFVQQMDKLLGIAEAQKLLAAKLERQTNRLIYLTYVLVFLTVALLAAAYAQTRVILK